MPEKNFFRPDELRKEMGMRPETPGEKVLRLKRVDEQREQAARNLADAKEEAERKRSAEEAERATLRAALEAATRAGSMSELVRQSDALVRGFDGLDDGERAALGAKMDAVADQAMAGTEQEIKSASALAETLRKWKLDKAEREVGNARVISRAELTGEPVQIRPPKEKNPPSLMERFLKGFGRR
jgi:hypothetical protein